MTSASDTSWETGKITDKAVEALRARIGVPRDLSPWNSAATKDAIWHFALGVGDDNPLWWDEDYARGTRWGRMFAPPTFLYSCSRGGPENGRPAGGLVEFEDLQGVMGLWSTDRWIWYSHTWAGEPIRATIQLDEVNELEGRYAGRSISHVDKTTYYGADDRIVAELYHTVIRIEREAGKARGKYLDTPPAKYSEADLRAQHEQYEREPLHRRGDQTRFWDDIADGDDLVTILKGPLTLTNMIGWQQGWGSLLCQTNRLAYQTIRDYPGTRLMNDETGIEDTLAAGHWDPYFTTRGGMPRGYDFGGQRISWLAHLLTDWCGDDGFVAGLSAKLIRPNLMGDCQWLTGKVTGKSPTLEPARHGVGLDYGVVECQLTATNQRSEITANVTATVALPKRSSGVDPRTSSSSVAMNAQTGAVLP